MKKTLLIALLLIPFLGISQAKKPIDGFLGIKFGSSRAVVVAALKARGASIVKESTAERAIFINVKLGQRDAEFFSVSFINDKAYKAYFSFKPEDEPKTLDYYSKLASDIDEIYGPGKRYTEFKSPFKSGDGDEITAIKGGYATIFTEWKSDKNLIQASIGHNEDEILVSLLYEDGVLFAENEAKQKAKEKSDY